MNFIQLSIPDVVLIELDAIDDERGCFIESYNQKVFQDGLHHLGLTPPQGFVQDNYSFSKKGVVRGLHFQCAPHAQGKLIRVLSGSIYDVVVDLRPDSPTLGRWVSAFLNEDHHRMLWIPEGFAHGFMALSDGARVMYKVTQYYSPACERAIYWADPALAIDWPHHVNPILSPKDATASCFHDVVKAR